MAPDERPAPTHVVEWQDEFGSTYTWPHRMSARSMSRERVLARIHRFDMPIDESTLRIWKIVRDA